MRDYERKCPPEWYSKAERFIIDNRGLLFMIVLYAIFVVLASTSNYVPEFLEYEDISR
jgi:hypothetical protein